MKLYQRSFFFFVESWGTVLVLRRRGFREAAAKPGGVRATWHISIFCIPDMRHAPRLRRVAHTLLYGATRALTVENMQCRRYERIS